MKTWQLVSGIVSIRCMTPVINTTACKISSWVLVSGGPKGTQGLGLQDLAVKVKMNPIAGWTLKMDYHYFYTAEGVNASPNVSGVAASSGAENDGSFLGNELDVTAIHKMNSATKVIIGYSNFNTGQAFRSIRSATTGANKMRTGLTFSLT